MDTDWSQTALSDALDGHSDNEVASECTHLPHGSRGRIQRQFS